MPVLRDSHSRGLHHPPQDWPRRHFQPPPELALPVSAQATPDLVQRQGTEDRQHLRGDARQEISPAFLEDIPVTIYLLPTAAGPEQGSDYSSLLLQRH